LAWGVLLVCALLDVPKFFLVAMKSFPTPFFAVLFLFIPRLLPRAGGITSCWCLRYRLRSLGACWPLLIFLCGSKDVISRQNFAENLRLSKPFISFFKLFNWTGTNKQAHFS
jgi:hypothetical protein